VEITDSNPLFTRIAAGAHGQILGSFASTIQGATMSREQQEKVIDVGQYVFGGAFFAVVAALTSAVMAVGFVLIEGVDRLRHH
jgi:hypothetical protein